MKYSFSTLCCTGLFLVGLISASLLTGCGRNEPVAESFQPNLVHALKYQFTDDVPMEQALEDTNWILTQMFGTPDDPKLPEVMTEEFPDLISMERLEKAAGPFADGRGLYRKHCVSCHGVTGDGRGENSGMLDPYPRDYRHGLFKFKSTKRSAKPVREDLARSIRNGIEGTAMVKIPNLSEDNVQALVDYVIYLSIRGELEREIINDGFDALDFESGERILNIDLVKRIEAGEREAIEAEIEKWEEAGEKEGAPGEKLSIALDQYDAAWGDDNYVEEFLLDIAEDWADAEDEVFEVPEPPTDIPVADNHAEFVQLQNSDQAEALAASIERGQQVFVGAVASCSKCHGPKGLGDGQNKDYDDWTKDWTTRVGLKPEDTEALIPLMARGAMPPKNARPRNFSEGVFRGGESAEDLYRRIYHGIAGSPMPASTFVPGQYEKTDIWHLINFIRSLEKSDAQVSEAI